MADEVIIFGGFFLSNKLLVLEKGNAQDLGDFGDGDLILGGETIPVLFIDDTYARV